MRWHCCFRGLSLPADLTGHSALHLDDVRGRGEAEAPQDAFPALELVHLQHGASLLQLLLGPLDVGRNLGDTRRG